jgi:hypothetical protein
MKHLLPDGYYLCYSKKQYFQRKGKQWGLLSLLSLVFSEFCLCYFEDKRILNLLVEYQILGYFRYLGDIIIVYNKSLIGTDDMFSEFTSNYGRLTSTLEYDHTTYRTNNLENSTSLSLLLHHAFG